MRRGVKACLVLVAVAVLLALSPARAALDGSRFHAVVDASIVRIDASGDQGQWRGTGFVVRGTRLVVTNYHVIEGAQALAITTTSGVKLQPTYIYCYDEDTDLAIIAVRGRVPAGLVVASGLGVKRGDPLAVVGNPDDAHSSLVRGRAKALKTGNGFVFLEMTVPLSPGWSGSPVMSAQGTVVAVVSFKSSAAVSQHLSFGVPAKYVRDLLQRKEPIPIGDARIAGAAARGATADRYCQMGWWLVWYRFDFPRAEECFASAYQRDSSRADALAGLALCRAAYMGQQKQALEGAGAALKNPQAAYEAYLAMAAASENDELMREYCRKAHALNGRRPHAHMIAAFRYASEGDVENTTRCLRQALARDASLRSNCHFLSGLAQFVDGDHAAAKKQLELCCKLDPGHDWARAFLAMSCLMTDDMRQAYSHATLSLQRSPFLPLNRATLAIYHAQKGHFDLARELLNEEEGLWSEHATFPRIKQILEETRQAIDALEEAD
jgi:tetratricopeptide (TPR) repeat protein